MVERLPRRALIALAALGAASGTQADAPPLARFAFEQEEALDTGPATFAVFRPARGDVKLSSAFRVSGARSVELRDAAGDHDFPELQGFFPVRREGLLLLRFALLTTDANAPWNVALAGPGGFVPGPDGIAFWLMADDGRLRHVSDSIPKPLFSLRAFVWYFFEARVDVSAGRYDLTVREEGGRDPLVALRDQPAASSLAGSALDKVSFVGDVLADAGAADFFVDDIVFSLLPAPDLRPFAAPGRRELFVDEWLRGIRQGGDAGPGEGDFARLVRAGEALSAEREALARLEGTPGEANWLERVGDAAYLQGDFATAERRYRSAAERDPSRTLTWLKLADMYYLLGDVAAERRCRERIFGTLSE